MHRIEGLEVGRNELESLFEEAHAAVDFARLALRQQHCAQVEAAPVEQMLVAPVRPTRSLQPLIERAIRRREIPGFVGEHAGAEPRLRHGVFGILGGFREPCLTRPESDALLCDCELRCLVQAQRS